MMHYHFDWEVFVGGAAFGLPVGQLLQTHVDPVSGYTRTAPVHAGFNINTLRFPDRNNYLLFTEYDFESNADSGTFLHHTWDVHRATFDAPDGLYAQVFAWTGDNRNVGIIFDEFTLTIRGTAETLASEVPEPAEARAVLFLLVAAMAFQSHRRQSPK